MYQEKNAIQKIMTVIMEGMNFKKPIFLLMVIEYANANINIILNPMK
jgi:TPP-dependent 2-oxoacid decarboxylase